MLNDIQKKYLATSLFALANIVIAGLVIGQVFSDIGITIVKTLFGPKDLMIFILLMTVKLIPHMLKIS